jgi:hypothetical protein
MLQTVLFLQAIWWQSKPRNVIVAKMPSRAKKELKTFPAKVNSSRKKQDR